MPAWLDLYVLMLADISRKAGWNWSREYILWELPFSVGMRLRSTNLFVRGHWTIRREKPIALPTPEDIAAILQ